MPFLPPYSPLPRCAKVCESWSSFISREFRDSLVDAQIDAYANTTDTTCNITRQALARIDTNALDTPPHTPIPALKPKMQTRICPQCRRSAKVLNLRRSGCLSPDCRFDFCTQCFRQWHDGECKKDHERSKNSVSEKLYVAGTKRSKKRLKRLSANGL